MYASKRVRSGLYKIKKILFREYAPRRLSTFSYFSMRLSWQFLGTLEVRRHGAEGTLAKELDRGCLDLRLEAVRRPGDAQACQPSGRSKRFNLCSEGTEIAKRPRATSPNAARGCRPRNHAAFINAFRGGPQYGRLRRFLNRIICSIRIYYWPNTLRTHSVPRARQRVRCCCSNSQTARYIEDIP